MESTRLESLQGQAHLYSPKRPDVLYSSPSLLFSGYVESLGRIKQLGRDVDNSSPSRVEVKNEWGYTPTPLYAFILNQYCSGDNIEKNQK